MPAAVVVRDLVKRYGGVAAVAGVGFEASGGEIFGLLGPNGAGKTSTLECVVGLRRPDAGSVHVCGIDAAEQPAEVKQRIGVQLQATALQDKITPREALRLFASFYRRAAAVETLIGRFSLAEKADAPFDTLSGGQRQRLALALAFVNEPDVLFLDEPTTGLDPQSRRDLHDAIRQIRGEGRAVVLTTHYIEEAHALCDRVAIIDHGTIVATGSPEDLIARSRAVPGVTFRAARPLEEDWVRELAAVESVERAGEGWRLRTPNVSRSISDLVRRLEAEGNELTDLQVRKPSLEDVFIELTGRALRD